MDAVTTIERAGPRRARCPARESRARRGGMNLFVILVVGFVIFNAILPILLSAVHSKVFGWVVYPLIAVPAYLLPAVLVSPAWGLFGLGGWLVLFPAAADVLGPPAEAGLRRRRRAGPPAAAAGPPAVAAAGLAAAAGSRAAAAASAAAEPPAAGSRLVGSPRDRPN